ncbi:MAG: hypothetical protein KDK91_29860 [Gammaproteobacteria bacterium]|nr:hypothetical protein [Gammaproteobacteria bacterium]
MDFSSRRLAMKTVNLLGAFGAAAVVMATSLPVSAEIVSRSDTQELIAGAAGKHWYHRTQTWYDFIWHADGTVGVRDPSVQSSEKPLDVGKWWIKTVERGEDESDESFEARNAALKYTFCQQLGVLYFGHELCWEIDQETFDKVEGDDQQLLKTQRYKLNREGAVETGEFIITRR